MDYFCNQGYSLQGSSRVFCDQNGQWGSTPTCQQGDTFCADNLSAHKFKIIIINTLCLFWWQKWTFSFLQCAHVVVHQVFQMVTLVQDRVHTTVVLLWTILVTKDSLYKAAVEWLAIRIDSGDLLLPAKEVNLKFTIHSGLPNTVIHILATAILKHFVLLSTVCTCGNPPTISNGGSNPNRGPLNCGSSVDYFCNQGYSLQGSSRVFCDQNGQWGSTPTCQQGDTFCADNLSAHKFKIIIINTLCLFWWQKWTFSFLQCDAVVHQVFQMVTLVQDRVHTTVVLLWTILVTKDSLYKVAVEWLAIRIDSGDLLLPAKEVNMKFVTYLYLPHVVFQTLATAILKHFVLLSTVCTCGNPPTISNGGSNPNRGPLNCGSSVDYFCNQGYSLQGSSRVFCDQNGQWGSTPTCQQGDTFCADNLSAHKFKIIIINTLCLFWWQKWTFSFLQCAHVVVHQVFQMVTLVQDRVHTTVVLLWTILVTKDSLYKAAVEWEWLATRILSFSGGPLKWWFS